jgi:hypothetical protein
LKGTLGEVASIEHVSGPTVMEVGLSAEIGSRASAAFDVVAGAVVVVVAG